MYVKPSFLKSTGCQYMKTHSVDLHAMGITQQGMSVQGYLIKCCMKLIAVISHDNYYSPLLNTTHTHLQNMWQLTTAIKNKEILSTVVRYSVVLFQALFHWETL
jgi:hypothetical protein